MRNASTDQTSIFNKYKMLKESTANMGYATPGHVQNINVGSEGPVIPRSPIASLKGEVPGTNGGSPEDEENDIIIGKLTDQDKMTICQEVPTIIDEIVTALNIEDKDSDPRLAEAIKYLIECLKDHENTDSSEDCEAPVPVLDNPGISQG